YYDGHLDISFEPAITNKAVDPAPLVKALTTFAAAARRLPAPAPEQEDQTQNLRTDLAIWASGWQEKVNAHKDLRAKNAVTLLSTLYPESEARANPQTADMIEALQKTIRPVLAEVQKPPDPEQVSKVIEGRLPVFIYFENYGMLDSAIYL